MQLDTKDAITKEDLRFAIVSKDEAEACVVVCYWAEGYTFKAQYNVQLPVDTQTAEIPKGQDLADYLLAQAPLDYFNEQIRRFKAAVFIDYSEIDRLIEEGKDTWPAD